MNTFDVRRWVNVLKVEWTAQRYLLLSLTIYAFLFALWRFWSAIDSYSLISNSVPDYWKNSSFIKDINITLLVVLFLLCIGPVSCMFGDKRQKKLALLMLPATAIEKFSVRLFYAVILMPLFVFLAYLLADIARIYLIQPYYILPPSFSSLVIPGMFDVADWWLVDSLRGFLECFIFAFMPFVIMSIYLLGACYWERYAFFKTTCWIIGGVIILIIILLNCAPNKGMREIFTWMNGSSWIVYALSLLWLVLFVYNIMRGYLLFCTTDLRSRKLFGLM